MLPYSEACERNKNFILERLKFHFEKVKSVLEIGSGTAQHAVHFAEQMPFLTWQTSDRQAYIEGIQQRLLLEGTSNTKQPLFIDVAQENWGIESVDAVYSANTLHIMSKDNVEQLLCGAGRIVAAGGFLAIYGPFKYKAKFTSQSNDSFDQYLRAQSLVMGIRDFEWVNSIALKSGFELLKDYQMPANNQFIFWRKLVGENK